MAVYYSRIQLVVPPSDPTDVVRLGDLQSAVESKFKVPVRLAATANLAAAYSAGAKTLTASANGALALDGVAAAANNRILVLGQTTGTQNGIYVVTSAGDAGSPWVLTRSADFDETDDIYAGVKVHVTEGTENDDVTYVLATDDPITLDTTALVFTPDTGLYPPVREYAETLTGISAVPVAVTHNLGTLDVDVEVYRLSDKQTVYVDITRTDANTISLGFASVPAGDFRVLVRAL